MYCDGGFFIDGQLFSYSTTGFTICIFIPLTILFGVIFNSRIVFCKVLLFKDEFSKILSIRGASVIIVLLKVLGLFLFADLDLWLREPLFLLKLL